MTMPCGFLLKKKPSLTMLETPREQENRSNALAACGESLNREEAVPQQPVGKVKRL
jgi:hypothetical protein